MMSDLLASDNINLHNRVGKRDHAHTTLAPPHHESQRTRDQRKGPPGPTGPDVGSESGFHTFLVTALRFSRSNLLS